MANMDRLLRKLNSLKAMVNLSSGAIFHAEAQCATPEDTETVQSAVRAIAGFARLGIRDRPALLAAIDTVAAGTQGTTVNIDADIPAELLDDLFDEGLFSTEE